MPCLYISFLDPSWTDPIYCGFANSVLLQFPKISLKQISELLAGNLEEIVHLNKQTNKKEITTFLVNFQYPTNKVFLNGIAYPDSK